jgi:WD40 repeat protein
MPQISLYADAQSPIPAASDPTAVALMPSGLPNSQNWDQGATIGKISKTVGLAHRLRINMGRVNRRRAIGWIVGGITAVGIGLGVSIYLYENGQFTSTHSPIQNQHNTPVAQNLPNTPPAQNQQNTPQSQQTTQGVTARHVLTGHSDEVRCVSWSPNGSNLASGSLDKSVRIWDPETQQTLLTYTGHTQAVKAIAYAQSGLLASGGGDNVVRVWNSNTGEDTISSRDLGGEVSSLTWTASNAAIFVGTLGTGLHEINMDQKLETPLGAKNVIDTLSLSPDGRYLAIGLRSGTVTILSLPSKTLFHTYASERTNTILALAWSPKSDLLAIVNNNQKVDILDLTTRSIVKSTTTISNVNSLSWEPGNTGRLAMARADGTISIWDTINDTQISGAGHTGAVTAVAWGNRYLASASADKTIILWNVSSYKT